MNITTRIIISTALLVATHPAKAENNSYYIGGGVGASHVHPVPEAGYPNVNITEDRDVGMKIYVGRDFGRNWAVEGHYSNLGTAKLQPYNGEVDYSVAGVSALYRFYQSPGYSQAGRSGIAAYGRVGIGGMVNEARNVHYKKNKPGHVLVGVGAEYKFSDQFAARAEIDVYDQDAALASMSGLMRFGGTTQSVMALPPALTGGSADADNDGVPDAVDQCDGAIGTVANFGCPATPSLSLPIPTPVPVPVPGYNDGGYNNGYNSGVGYDQGYDASQVSVVEHTPGAYVPNEHVSTTGGYAQNYQAAPVPNTPAVDAGPLGRIFFAMDSHHLDDTARAALGQLGDYLRNNPSAQVRFDGHTCGLASESYNQGLSERRAQAVKHYVQNMGIAGHRLQTSGFGESRPIASNATPLGQQQNRRVDIVLY